MAAQKGKKKKKKKKKKTAKNYLHIWMPINPKPI